MATRCGRMGKTPTLYSGDAGFKLSANIPAVPRKLSSLANAAVVAQSRLPSNLLFSSPAIYRHYTLPTTYTINRIRNALITQYRGAFA